MKKIKQYWGLPFILIVILIGLSFRSTIFYNKINMNFNNKFGISNYLFEIVDIDTIYLDTTINELAIEKIKIHNTNILSDLHDRRTTTLNSINNNWDIIAQTRSIYFALLVVIIGFLLTRQESINKKTNLKIYCLVSLAIISMYLIEINTKDQLLKSRLTRNLINNGIDKIFKSENIDKTYYLWYNISFEDRASKINEINKNTTKWSRKFVEFFSPNIVQIIYYFVPIILILFMIMISQKNNN